MKKEDEKIKKEENKYLFYTQYYLTAGVYHVVNVVNSILNYSATYSSGVKEYLEEKVLLQKTIIDDIVADANKKKFEFDENDYVIIKMRKAAVVVQSVVPLPVPNKTFENNENINNINGGIVNEIVNDIINNAVLSDTVNTIVNDIINNAVDIVAARNSSCVPCVESLNHDYDDDGMPHHKSSIITSSYYAQFV
uniref:Uncharacterized protein n=1 Tax=viral metagenome TaxID=1070528 RepID=A0A6C0F0C8_9ZZZZ